MTQPTTEPTPKPAKIQLDDKKKKLLFIGGAVVLFIALLGIGKVLWHNQQQQAMHGLDKSSPSAEKIAEEVKQDKRKLVDEMSKEDESKNNQNTNTKDVKPKTSAGDPAETAKNLAESDKASLKLPYVIERSEGITLTVTDIKANGAVVELYQTITGDLSKVQLSREKLVAATCEKRRASLEAGVSFKYTYKVESTGGNLIYHVSPEDCL